MNYIPSVVLVLFGIWGIAMPYYRPASVLIYCVSASAGMVLFMAGCIFVLVKNEKNIGKIVPVVDLKDGTYVIYKQVSNITMIIKDGSMNYYGVDPTGEMLQMSEGQAFQKIGERTLKI